MFLCTFFVHFILSSNGTAEFRDYLSHTENNAICKLILVCTGRTSLDGQLFKQIRTL